MADDARNTLSPGTRDAPPAAGDVPERLRRRYFTDDKGGPGLGFYVDATVPIAAFRDRGRQLIAPRADPNTIRDMVAIAQHRGWSIISVRGAQDFRRESWLAASALGLEVRGYTPTERDLQALTRKLEARARQRQRDQPDPSAAWARRRVDTEPGTEKPLAGGRGRGPRPRRRPGRPNADPVGRPRPPRHLAGTRRPRHRAPDPCAGPRAPRPTPTGVDRAPLAPQPRASQAPARDEHGWEEPRPPTRRASPARPRGMRIWRLRCRSEAMSRR